ncbi:zinc ribbon domain-containing protein [Natrinema versiforme]|uniref:Transposase n=1 Tax=Natrinema versiforme TaxID=88724 RepID=A0A4P8WGG0_9EURY|nr:zinc ribbon domain-containing protein [Natrinema versiforme]QCS42370.1 transposase [Natrinema versiforme]
MCDRAETAIGVDVGEYNLYTACPIDLPDWRGAHAVCGDDLCQRLDDLRLETAALLASSYDRTTIAAYVQQRCDALVAALDAAARTVCEYATAYDDPVLVTEDSHYRPDLWAWLTDPDAHRGSTWLLAAAHLRLRAVAAEYRLPVTTVPEAYSTQECHACGVLGTRELNTTVRCVNSDCHVDTVTADFNAARVLARRYYPGRCCDYRPRASSCPGDLPGLAADGGLSD